MGISAGDELWIARYILEVILLSLVLLDLLSCKVSEFILMLLLWILNRGLQRLLELSSPSIPSRLRETGMEPVLTRTTGEIGIILHHDI